MVFSQRLVRSRVAAQVEVVLERLLDGGHGATVGQSVSAVLLRVTASVALRVDPAVFESRVPRHLQRARGGSVEAIDRKMLVFVV